MQNDAFHHAKSQVLANLELIQISLVRCIDEGMIDTEATSYNEVLDLIDEAHAVKAWEGLLEVVVRGKTVENDVAAWLARHGRTTVSLLWPKKG